MRLFTILPLLALAAASHQPPYLRHRRAAAAHNEREASFPEAQVAPRANTAHAAAHRVIKRTFNKRGEQCRPRAGQLGSKPKPEETATISDQNAWAQGQVCTPEMRLTNETNTLTATAGSSSQSGNGSNGQKDNGNQNGNNQDNKHDDDKHDDDKHDHNDDHNNNGHQGGQTGLLNYNDQ